MKKLILLLVMMSTHASAAMLTQFQEKAISEGISLMDQSDLHEICSRANSVIVTNQNRALRTRMKERLILADFFDARKKLALETKTSAWSKQPQLAALSQVLDSVTAENSVQELVVMTKQIFEELHCK